MSLDKDELMYTRILNHNATAMEITDYIDELHKEIKKLRMKIKNAKERIEKEIRELDEFIKEEYNNWGKSSDYEIFSEQLDTLEDIEMRLK